MTSLALFGQYRKSKLRELLASYICRRSRLAGIRWNIGCSECTAESDWRFELNTTRVHAGTAYLGKRTLQNRVTQSDTRRVDERLELHSIRFAHADRVSPFQLLKLLFADLKPHASGVAQPKISLKQSRLCRRLRLAPADLHFEDLAGIEEHQAPGQHVVIPVFLKADVPCLMQPIIHADSPELPAPLIHWLHEPHAHRLGEQKAKVNLSSCGSFQGHNGLRRVA